MLGFANPELRHGMAFLSIDPGEHAGWCVLDDELKITVCGIDRPPAMRYRVVLVERPTIYPRSRVDPANIITLAITLGKIVGRLEGHGFVGELKEVEPRTWKGQIPKPIHHAAIRRALRPSEQQVVDVCLKDVRAKLREDAMDAVGLADYGRRMRLFV